MVAAPTDRPHGDAYVALLYLLARDHLPVGTITAVIRELEGAPIRGEGFVFTNEHLAAWAAQMIDRLDGLG